MLAYLDALTDLQFMSIFIVLLVATFVVELIVDVIGKRCKQ